LLKLLEDENQAVRWGAMGELRRRNAKVKVR